MGVAAFVKSPTSLKTAEMSEGKAPICKHASLPSVIITTLIAEIALLQKHLPLKEGRCPPEFLCPFSKMDGILYPDSHNPLERKLLGVGSLLTKE